MVILLLIVQRIRGRGLLSNSQQCRGLFLTVNRVWGREGSYLIPNSAGGLEEEGSYRIPKSAGGLEEEDNYPIPNSAED